MPCMVEVVMFSVAHLNGPNQSLEPTAGRRDTHIDFMKQSLELATPGAASGGSATSR
jgi:hypothetical protein